MHLLLGVQLYYLWLRLLFLFLSLDGSSPFPFIVTYFPEEIDDSNLPPHWNIAESLQLETSPTLLYDVETGM